MVISEGDVMNKTVKVIIDRPLGSYHPKHKNIYYSVNYGYVPGIIAPDGEEQDAYVLGINKPIKEFTGEVVAIIHRNDDIEEKWVVVPQGMKITKAEIQEQVHFQEKYFESLIEMLI
ncbi:inorganic pyrophosphatase [Clostridium beijerinckii]|nr:inorganic pyrophosphatase [Clostridium beijerinckii]MBA8934277.1 inorganic pyrophosphatase [Clostridium beijerinckii]